MTQQRQILVAIDELPQDFWKHWENMVQVHFARTGTEAYQMLSGQCFHLVFVDLYLTGMDGLELLRRIRTEGLCDHVVLTSSVPSFSYAQQGFLYGASAYLLRPLQEEEVETILRKTLSSTVDASGAVQKAAAYVVQKLRSQEVEKAILHAGERLLPPAPDEIHASAQLRDLWLEVVNQTYLHYPWLKLYHQAEEFTSLDYVQENDGQMLLNLFRRRLLALHQAILTLFPVTTDAMMEEVERTLLETIDSNPQQKAIAEQFYLASSTLSIHFQKKVGLTYREYITRLKILRGQYLLRYTEILPEELAGKLGYRDRAHFAKLYLEHTGTPLQRLRKEKWSDYQI